MPYMPLAGGVETTQLKTPDELFAGDMPVVTGQGDIGSVAVTEFQVLMVGDEAPNVGKLVAWDGTPGAAVAIAATAIGANRRGAIYEGGYFNHAMLGWPAGASADTYAERKAAFAPGGTIKIGRVL